MSAAPQPEVLSERTPRPRRRRGWFARLFNTCVLLVFFAVLGWTLWVYHGIKSTAQVDNAQPADAIAVFGAAEYAGRPSPVLHARLDKAVAEQIFDRAGGIPNDVQWLAHAAFEHSLGPGIDGEAIDAGLAAIVVRQSSSFAERFEALAPSQQRTLKALAASPTEHVYSRRFLDQVDVANANAVRKALAALGRAELVERSDGAWRLTNPFLRAWLLQH